MRVISKCYGTYLSSLRPTERYARIIIYFSQRSAASVARKGHPAELNIFLQSYFHDQGAAFSFNIFRPAVGFHRMHQNVTCKKCCVMAIWPLHSHFTRICKKHYWNLTNKLTQSSDYARMTTYFHWMRVSYKLAKQQKPINVHFIIKQNKTKQNKIPLKYSFDWLMCSTNCFGTFYCLKLDILISVPLPGGPYFFFYFSQSQHKIQYFSFVILF